MEELTLPELCAVIDEFVTEFNSIHHHDSVLTAVQAQPSFLCGVLDTKAVCNYHHLRVKALGHAVLRKTATRDYISSDDGYLIHRLRNLYSGFDFQSVLVQLCPDVNQYWGQVKSAEFDLSMQLVAPSVYMDPLKMGVLFGKAASPLQHPLRLLWDDTTLASLIFSPLLERILAAAIPVDHRDTIEFLRHKALVVVLWHPKFLLSL